MENLIKLLPDNIANQIAAGEVIQRPASVVKELMENAIDAGATKIDVHIKDAGKTLIQVVDNGQGMSPSDALLCFERHATSKVRTADDLFALHTKGFRGEALASIAAIAHVEMHTRRAQDEFGQNIVIEGSKLQVQEAMACPHGTSFEIKNLFFNVPARRNFLKKDSTEFGHIVEEFERIAFAHPELHLSLMSNGVPVHNLQPAILRKRIIQLLGLNLNDKLVPIEESTDIVRVEGYVLKPEHARKTRGDQYFFVNERFFKSTYFNHAISKAFEGLIKDGCFPGYFLYLHVDTHKIDVNVHPTKTEIKFEEDKYIYSILLSSVRQALGKYNIAPTIEFDRETSFDIPHAMRSQIPQEPVIQVNPNFNPFTSNTGSSSKGVTKDNLTPAIHSQGFGNARASSADWENFYTIEDEKTEDEQARFDYEEVLSEQSTFIVKGPYIISPSKSGLMVIHIRRALERIVYSEVFNQFISRPIDSQKLLFPIEKEVSRNESQLWENNSTILTQLGFEGATKDGILSVHAVPAILQEESIAPALDDLFSSLAYEDVDKGDIAHTMIRSIARGASMKRTPITSQESVDALINRLFLCEEHAYSPGNKKIIETISLEELQDKLG